MPLKNPAEEIIVQVLTREAPRKLTTRDVWRAVQEVRAIELDRCWELLWGMFDRKLVKSDDLDGRRWSV